MKESQKNNIIDTRRNQIREAAYRVVCNKGYNNFTIRDIAKEAGLSVGLIHYYFKDKEDLLLSLLKEMNSNLKRTTIKFLSKSDDPVEKLKIFINLAYKQVNDEKEYYYVIIDFWSQANRNERMKKANIRLFESYHDMCSQILEEGIKKEVFGEIDIKYTTTVIISLIQGIIVQYIINNNAFNYNDYVERIISQIINMVIKKK